MTKRVEVYSTEYCPYCRAAESLLKNKGIPFKLYDVTEDHEKRAWLVEASGQRTVPQIFIDQKSIGGFTELRALSLKGELESLIEA